jgi:hypothetical protein
LTLGTKGNLVENIEGSAEFFSQLNTVTATNIKVTATVDLIC